MIEHKYRPGQPNWECTMWIFLPLRFYVKLILIILKPYKTALLTIRTALKFEFLGHLDIFKHNMFPKIKIQRLQNC